MSVIQSLKKDNINMYIDWDRYKNMFYNNIYLEDYKFVIKMPLLPQKNSQMDIKIKKFNLTKYTYLISYD
ncbi:MAG: hypothetical protein CEE42_09730 [Promethearchaeota archaeon Loki_b31]|nr:MAG: hypothetical protein CEE42_09730 [Candidatus Lokiarchaeota archaeon Loki_b31]